MELARIEINSAQNHFQNLLSEKEEQIKRSRSLAQQNEDTQVRNNLEENVTNAVF